MKKLIFYLFCVFFTFFISGFQLNTSDNELFSFLLRKYVDPNGLVDYNGFFKDKNKLNDYLSTLAESVPNDNWTVNQEKSYWINVYNAFTIKLVVDNYPVKSILDINQGKPWDLSFIKLGEKLYTLNQIENEILRKKFNDPRIHFAINCASISCPKLLPEAYNPSKLENQLELMTAAFINNKDRNSVSTSVIKISKLFDWFKEDFSDSGGVVPFISKYIDMDISAQTKVIYQDYNWNINQQ